MWLGEEGQVIREEVLKKVFGDHMKGKGVMRKL
jgi:hypothetical protein